MSPFQTTRAKRRLAIGFLAVPVVLTMAVRSRGDDGDGAEARILAEAAKGLARLEKPFPNIQCRGGRIEIYPASKRQMKLDLRFCVKDEKRLFISTYDLNATTPSLRPPETSATCRTPSVFFRLERPAADAGFAVDRRAVPPFDAKTKTQLERSFFHGMDIWMNAAFSLRDRPVRALMSDPRFKATRVAKIHKDGRDLVRVDFASRGCAFWCDWGWFELEPALNWAVHDFQVQYPLRPKYDAQDRGSVDCERWPGGFVFPRKVRYLITENGAAPGIYEVKFSDVKLGGVTDDEFTLSAFGLPESPPKAAVP